MAFVLLLVLVLAANARRLVVWTGMIVTQQVGDQTKKSGSMACSKDQIRDSTVRLVRTLITLATTLKPLPKQRFLTMKLQYREEVTPPGTCTGRFASVLLRTNERALGPLPLEMVLLRPARRVGVCFS